MTDLKVKYPGLMRVYVRAEYEFISPEYRNYLSVIYEETYFSEKAHNAGKLVYIARNREMIDKSDVCVFYYDKEKSAGSPESSGTKLAFEYADKRRKTIINIF